MVKFSDKGSGWHKEGTRHSRAKKYGTAGGNYHVPTRSKKLRKLTYSQLKKKGVKLSANGDADHDKVINRRDCRPFNPKMQDNGLEIYQQSPGRWFATYNGQEIAEGKTKNDVALSAKQYLRDMNLDSLIGMKSQPYGGKPFTFDEYDKKTVERMLTKKEQKGFVERYPNESRSAFALAQAIQFDRKKRLGHVSISEARSKNEQAGKYFFSRKTMNFFNSRIETKGNLIKGKYFITSERQDDNSPRRYTIREFDKDTGEVNTVGTFQGYTSYGDAVAEAKTA